MESPKTTIYQAWHQLPSPILLMKLRSTWPITMRHPHISNSKTCDMEKWRRISFTLKMSKIPTATIRIGSNDNGSNSYWPPGSLHTLGAGVHIKQNDWLFMWIKILRIRYILWIVLTTKSMFDVENMQKKDTVNGMPINNHELLNIQACSFHVFWNTGCTQSLVVSCKYWVVPLISTRVSGYSQVILFLWTLIRNLLHKNIYTIIYVMRSSTYITVMGYWGCLPSLWIPLQCLRSAMS